MKTPGNYLIFGLIALGLFFVGLLSGRVNKSTETVRLRTDTVISVRVDTVLVERPVPVRVVEVRTDTIHHVVPSGDTIYVPVPIRQYTFKGEQYRIEMSGYQVQADRIEVYPRTETRYITNETIRTVNKRNRFGLGISAGYGFTKEGLSPYIGLGIQYNLLEF